MTVLGRVEVTGQPAGSAWLGLDTDEKASMDRGLEEQWDSMGWLHVILHASKPTECKTAGGSPKENDQL